MILKPSLTNSCHLFNQNRKKSMNIPFEKELEKFVLAHRNLGRDMTEYEKGWVDAHESVLELYKLGLLVEQEEPTITH